MQFFLVLSIVLILLAMFGHKLLGFDRELRVIMALAGGILGVITFAVHAASSQLGA